MHVSSRRVGRLLLTAAQQGRRTRNPSTAPSLAVRGIPVPATSPHGAAPGRAAAQSRAQPGCGTRLVILSPVTQSAWAAPGWQAERRVSHERRARESVANHREGLELCGTSGSRVRTDDGRGLPHGDADGCRGHTAGRRRCTAKQGRAELQDGFPCGATSSRNTTRRWRHPTPHVWGTATRRSTQSLGQHRPQSLQASSRSRRGRIGSNTRAPNLGSRSSRGRVHKQARPQASAPRPRAGRLPRGRAGQRAPEPRNGTGRDGSAPRASRSGPTAQRREGGEGWTLTVRPARKPPPPCPSRRSGGGVSAGRMCGRPAGRGSSGLLKAQRPLSPLLPARPAAPCRAEPPRRDSACRYAGRRRPQLRARPLPAALPTPRAGRRDALGPADLCPEASVRARIAELAFVPTLSAPAVPPISSCPRSIASPRPFKLLSELGCNPSAEAAPCRAPCL